MPKDERQSEVSLLGSLQRRLLSSSQAFRQAHPYRFVQPSDEFVFIENVAEILGTSVDFVRRIPKSALPAVRIGKRLIYARSDVRMYVERRREMVDRDVGRGSSPLECVVNVGFDPVQIVRSSLMANRPIAIEDI
jgi:hypothetical protein